MFKSSLCFGLCVYLIFTSNLFGQASFQGLGDLSGGIFHSEALGISSDGSVIVGQGTSASGIEAFRWTSEGGMVGLGDLSVVILIVSLMMYRLMDQLL